MEKETKICPYCGGEILAVAKKCKHCGQWLEEKQTPVVTSKKSNNGIIYAVIGLVALVLVVVIGVSISSKSSTSAQGTEQKSEIIEPASEEPAYVEVPSEAPSPSKITSLRPGMKCSDAVKSTHLLFWMFGDIDDMGQYATIIVSDNTANKVYKTNIVFYGQSGSEHLTTSGREKVDEAWANAALEIGGLTPSDFKSSAVLVKQ